MKNESANIPVLSIDRTVSLLSWSYLTLIGEGVSPKAFPSVMLWGPPGVGKSQAVRQIAKKIEEGSGKRTAVTDVRLLLFNPIDLRGIPVANEDRTLAVWLKPKIFQMDGTDDVINILFLDEISAAPQSVQAAAYQITLDRIVGEHRLPDNCIVIAAGNRVTDKSVAFKMPKALANRLMHIQIDGSFESWRNWAEKNGIHRNVIGFLTNRRERLFGFDAATDDLAFTTPRSWEMVSNILNGISGDIEMVFPLIAGLVGNATAIEFKAWCMTHSKLPSMEEIFSGRAVTVPKENGILYALVASMTGYASEHMDNAEMIGNSLAYAVGFPMDFARLLIDNYRSIREDYEEFLRSLPEYQSFCGKKGIQFNGSTE